MLDTILSFVGKVLKGFLSLIPDWILEKVEQLIASLLAVQLLALLIFLFIFFGNTIISLIYNLILVPMFPKIFAKKRKILNSIIFAIPIIGWIYVIFQLLYSLGRFIYNVTINTMPKQNGNTSQKNDFNKLNKFLNTQNQVQQNQNINETYNNQNQQINNNQKTNSSNSGNSIHRNMGSGLSDKYKNKKSGIYSFLGKENKNENKLSKFLK